MPVTLNAVLGLNSEQFKSGLKSAEQSAAVFASRMPAHGEQAGKGFNTKFARFAGHLGGAGPQSFMLFSGLASSIEESNGSLAKFGKSMGSTLAVVGAVVGINAAFEEGGKQIDQFNKRLNELGYKGTGYIGMIRVALGDLSGLEIDRAIVAANRLKRVLKEIADEDKTKFLSRYNEEVGRGLRGDDLVEVSKQITKTIALEKQLAAAVEARQDAQMLGGEPKTVTDLDRRVKDLQSRAGGAGRMAKDANIPSSLAEDAAQRQLKYLIEIERLQGKRPGMVDSEKQKGIADAEKSRLELLKERERTVQSIAHLEQQIADQQESNVMDGLDEAGKRQRLTSQIGVGTMQSALSMMTGSVMEGLKGFLNVEQLKGQLLGIKEAAKTESVRPAAGADQYAQVGLFAGGASAAMDYARRTAESTMTLVELVRRGIKVNAMDVRINAGAVAQ